MAEGLSRVFQVGQNTTRDMVVDFDPEFIAVDNPGSYWIHFPQTIGAFQWIRPGVFNAIVPAPNTGRAINVTTSDVPIGYPAPAASLALATLTVYEKGAFGGAGGGSPLSPNPGVPGVLTDTNAADIKAVTQTFGNRSAGVIGQAADAGHVHVGWLSQIAMVQNGPLPFTTPGFNINFSGSSLLLMLGATAIKLNSAGLLHVAFALDAGGFNDRTVYSSAFGPNEHRAFPMIQGLFGGMTIGAHTITVKTNDVNTGSDGNDQYALQLWEIPP